MVDLNCQEARWSFYDLINVQRFLNGANQSLSLEMRMQMRIFELNAAVVFALTLIA